jgi:protein-S-isoprenylcysteine O-methyltransferase Ste14
MDFLQTVPFVAMVAIIAATLVRGVAIRRRTGDHPLAFPSATGAQRASGLVFAVSTAALIVASGIGAQAELRDLSWLAAILAIFGAGAVIVAQIQMGRAWRIGVRQRDAPLFVSHGLFRYSRNPIFLAMMLVGLSAAMVSASWWAWLSWVTFVVACIVQVRIEEAHLSASFGSQYEEFKARVPRWLGKEGPG